VIDLIDVVTGHRQPWGRFLPGDRSDLVSTGMAKMTPDGRVVILSGARIRSSLQRLLPMPDAH
jgi:hypothetical protein